MSHSRYHELARSLARAREGFKGYRSECFFFAAQLSRGFADYAGWPRELISWESVDGAAPGAAAERIEDAIHLDHDGFWHFGMRLTLEEPKGTGSILLRVRFKKLETRFIVSLVGFEDFEATAPTPEALQPIYDSILNAVKRHFDYGLRLFLENGGRGLKIPISAEDLVALADER